MNNFTLLNTVKNSRFSFKNYYLKALLVIAFLGLSQIGFGQAFSVTYALTANGNSVVSGNVASTSLVGGSNIGAIGYGATNGSSANGFGSPALNLNDYYEYSISPVTGNNLAINSTSFYYSVSGGSMNLVVFYSKDNFATSGTQLGSIVNFSNTSSTVQFTNSTSITVNNGETLKVRVYGYGASADTRTFRNKTFVISGTSTSTSTSPTISTSGSLSALTTVYGTASSTSTFNVSGTLMDAGILVTPPAGFEVSTNSTSGFADSITVGAAGTISSTPVYVRLKATATVASYSGSIVLSSTNATNVNVATVSSTVTAKALTISGVTANNKVYDSFTTATLSGTPSFVGAVNGDTLTVSGTPSATFASATVGTGKPVTVTGYTVSGTNSTSYTVTQPTGLTADITQASQTISFTLASPVLYPSVLTITLGATATSGLAVTYASSNPAIASVSGNVVTIHSVGTVTITASQAGNTNYAAATNVDQTLDIQTNGLTDQTITFNALATATYGDAPITLTATASSSLPVTYTSSNTSVATVSGNTVTILTNGTTTITASQAGDASYNPAPNVQQTLTVNQKALTVTGAVASNKVYNRTTAATITGATLVGIVGTDVVTVSGAGTFADFNVGTAKPVTAALVLGGANASLYTLTQPSGLTADITPKALTVTGATVIAKVYDGTTVANLGGTPALSGIVSGDTGTVSIVTTSAVANYDTANVGTGKAVTVSGYTLSGASSGNYSLTQPSLTGNITAKALTITGVTADNKIQDGTTAATLSGTPTLVGVEAVDNGNVTVTGTPTATFASAAPGTAIAVTVTGYTLGGTAAGNYTVSQPTGLTADITGLSVPVATAATSVLQTTFDANWNAVSGATGYALDVLKDGQILQTGVEKLNNPGTIGASGWSETGVAQGVNSSNNYLQLLTATSVTASSTVDFSVISNAVLKFKARTFGGPSVAQATITVSISSDNGGSWTVLGTRIPGSSTLTDMTTFDLSAYNSNQVKVRFQTLGAGSSKGVGIDDIIITADQLVNGLVYIPGYQNLVVGNVTTYPVTVPSPETTYYYRVRAVNGSFQSADSNTITVTTKPVSVTWDGTAWSNTNGPDADIEAVISGAYDTSVGGVQDEFTAKKLTITSTPAGSLTIAAGTNVTVVNEVVNELTETAFVVESDGNLIQTNPNIVNTNAITVKRLSSPIRRLDYTLWSSPVDGQQLQAFSPGTVSTRFYTYNPSTNFYVSTLPSGDFVTGTGYLIRASNWLSDTDFNPWEGTFIGAPNNGDVTLSVANGTYNAIGNPYPSTIDADEFIGVNSITAPLYFWRKVNNLDAANNPTSSYATYTLAGGAGTAPNTAGGSSLVPDGTIQVGQGFIAQATSSSLVFSNTMRNGDVNSVFLRSGAANKSRIWLNLTNTTGIFSQALVAYMPTATTGIDAAIDGKFFETTLATQLSSIINGEEFAVQGRPAFTASDVVALGFKTQTEGNYTIAIDHVDGLFADGQEVFLKDNLTNTVHNLTNAPYNFVATAGTANTRFEIVYESTLATQNPVLNENMVTIYKQNQNLVVNTGAIQMKDVKVYDIQGRLLVEQNNVNAATAKLAISSTNQVLIVKITSKEGTIVTKKVVF